MAKKKKKGVGKEKVGVEEKGKNRMKKILKSRACIQLTVSLRAVIRGKNKSKTMHERTLLNGSMRKVKKMKANQTNEVKRGKKSYSAFQII